MFTVLTELELEISQSLTVDKPDMGHQLEYNI